jgi:hypothetical protein
MHEMIHPDAGAALRDFAAATLKGNKAAPTETIWVLPGPPGR